MELLARIRVRSPLRSVRLMIVKREVRPLGYRYMLGVILVLYIMIITITPPFVEGLLRVAVLGILLSVAIRTRREAGKLGLPAALLAVFLILVTIVADLTGSQTVATCAASGSTALLVTLVILIIGQSVLTAGTIDSPAVRGVLCVYLLLALLFSSLHQFAGALIPNYLHGVGAHPNASDSLYFSVITLATVGYGDITPVAGLARALAVAEALIGQLYLVSVVAAVVGRYHRGDS